MRHHYLKNVIRGALRNQQYLVINIIGLAIALATVILITLFVIDELSYDNWLNNVDSLYRIDTSQNTPERGTNRLGFTTGKLAPVISEYFTEEIESITRDYNYPTTVRRGNLQFNENLHYVDETFFNVFDLPMLQGRGEETFTGTNNIILSESMSTKYFAEENAIGQVLSIDHPPSNSTLDYQVVGVFKDLPINSHLDFDFITLLYEPRYINWTWVLDDWNSYNLITYIKLSAGQTIESVEQKFPAFAQSLPFLNMNEENRPPRYEFNFVNVADIHLFDDASPIKSFSFIALLILVIASINFTNLATAQAIRRAREVAMRKVLGVEKRQLILQFLGESVLTTVVAMTLGIVIVELVLPFYNQFLGKEIQLQFLNNITGMSGLLLFTIVVGVVGGAYPAFVLSSFRPARILHDNKSKSSGSPLLRETLVVFQFSISIFLIFSTLIIYAQLLYSQSIDPGFTRENRINLTGGAGFNQVAPVSRTLKQELLNIPGVKSVGIASDTFPSTFSNFMTVALPGNSLTETHSVEFTVVGVDFLSTFDAKLSSGRLFSENFPGDFPNVPQNDTFPITAGVVINQSLAKLSGFENPQDALGQKILRTGNRLAELNVVGVINDLHTESIHQAPIPTLYYVSEAGQDYIALEIDQLNIISILQEVNRVWNNVLPTVPVTLTFAEAAARELYSEDIKRASIFSCFAALAILISSIGLYGLAVFAAQSRTQEIGIRKVHGATVFSLVKLLLLKFSWPVIIANIIAWPVSYFYMDNWLNTFFYRVDLSLIYFVMASSLTILIAWGVGATHAIRVAVRSPIHALKTA